MYSFSLALEGNNWRKATIQMRTYCPLKKYIESEEKILKKLNQFWQNDNEIASALKKLKTYCKWWSGTDEE